MTTQFAPIWDDAAVAFTTIKANATDTASAANSTLLDLQVNNVSKFTVDKFGELILTPTARTSGSDSLLSLIAPADTTRAAGVEATDINFNLARTVQFAAGNIADQRAVRIQAPTYSFASASTITNASTLSISGAPVAGINATITNAYALNVESGVTRLGDRLILSAGSLTTPTLSFGTDLNTGIYQGGTDGQIRFVSNGNDTLALTDLIIAAYLPLRVSTIYSSTNVIEVMNSTNSQTLRLYNTFTNASNYERFALQFGTYSSARHAQIAAESAGTGIANINLLLTPRGTGALILGPPPDGTVTGGNARGANSVDFQSLRINATEVASGTRCFMFGERNTATGTNCYVGGQQNTASNTNTFAQGVNCVASAPAAFAAGSSSTASGQVSFAAGTSTASGVSSFSIGTYSLANRPSQFSHSSGRHAAFGDSQYIRLVGGIKTTDATPANIRLSGFGSVDGSGNWLSANAKLVTITSGTMLAFVAKIAGIKSDGSAVAFYMRKGVIKNVSGTVTLSGTIETIGTDIEDVVGTDVNISADNVNKALSIQVTGILNETWRWCVAVKAIEIAYGT